MIKYKFIQKKQKQKAIHVYLTLIYLVYTSSTISDILQCNIYTIFYYIFKKGRRSNITFITSNRNCVFLVRDIF